MGTVCVCVCSYLCACYSDVSCLVADLVLFFPQARDIETDNLDNCPICIQQLGRQVGSWVLVGRQVDCWVLVGKQW